jgi:hypothetical protein
MLTLDIDGHITIHGYNGSDLTVRNMIDEYGIDSTYLRWFPNMCFNSGFDNCEILNTHIMPTYWITSEGDSPSRNWSTDASRWMGNRSLMLNNGDSAWNNPATAPINTSYYSSVYGNARVSFYTKGGNVTVEAFTVTGGAKDATHVQLSTGGVSWVNSLTTSSNSNWSPSSRFNFIANTSGVSQWVLQFTNNSGSAAYIDAVQIEPDWTRNRPGLYTDGPNSEIYIPPINI